MALDPVRQAILSGSQPTGQGGLSSERLAILGMEPKEPADSQLIRSGLQGLTFGWSDEIEAAVRSVVPESMGGRKYEEIRDEIRGKLTEYKKENPGKAITSEVVGAIIPTIVATVLTGGAAAPAVAPTLGRLAGIGAVQGGLTGAGTSEAESAQGILGDTAVGTITGAAFGPAVALGGKQVASKAGGLIDWAKEKLGKTAGSAVQAELRRLAEATGKSVDEIVDDVANGRLMSDNATLMIALKGYVTKGGASGQAVRQMTQDRAKETAGIAQESLRRELAPKLETNVVRGFKKTKEELEKAESDAYKKIFSTTPDVAVTDDIAADMLHAAQTVPRAMDEVNSIYNMEKLVPLFVKRENGAIEMVRQPTLQDAEIMRRKLGSSADSLFKSPQGDKTIARSISDIEKSLKSKIDVASPELRKTRASWATIQGASDNFDAGRKALSMNVDDLDILVGRLRSDPQQFSAFKAGVMDAIRNTVRRSGTTFTKLADEDQQMGAVLRTVLNDRDISALERQLKTAGETKMIAQKVLPEAGSPTELLRREMDDAGTRLSLGDVFNVTSGSPMMIIQTMARLMKQKAPMLSDEQTMKVVQTMFSREPDVVRKALTDAPTMEALMDKYGKLIAPATSAGLRAGTFEASKDGGLLNNFGANQ